MSIIASWTTVTLTHLHIIKGGDDTIYGGGGGSIENYGTLTINNSTLLGNSGVDGGIVI